ncbi:MAG: hypothetical protein HQ541_04020 [Mariniphaga sp.]|nr:hypothetical protein [Mariniphaga sp.]
MVIKYCKDLQNCPCRISVFQADFSGETVFWQLMNDPLCQSVINHVEIYYCKGEAIKVLENYDDWVVFNQNVSNLKIIYSCLAIRN